MEILFITMLLPRLLLGCWKLLRCRKLTAAVYFLQRAVLLRRQAAVVGPGQRGPPAAGLSAHAGALGDLPGEPHPHWSLRPGDHHPGAPGQRLVHLTGGPSHPAIPLVTVLVLTCVCVGVCVQSGISGGGASP